MNRMIVKNIELLEYKAEHKNEHVDEVDGTAYYKYGRFEATYRITFDKDLLNKVFQNCQLRNAFTNLVEAVIDKRKESTSDWHKNELTITLYESGDSYEEFDSLNKKLEEYKDKVDKMIDKVEKVYDLMKEVMEW